MIFPINPYIIIYTLYMMLYFCNQPHQHWWQHLYYPYYPNSPHNSKHMFDIYSLTHIFWPLLLVLCSRLWLPKQYHQSMIILISILVIAFEIHENLPQQIKKYQRIEIDSMGHTSYRGDTIINSIGDIISNFIGIYLAIHMSTQTNIYILIILFSIITCTVSFTYWTDFLKFAT